VPDASGISEKLIRRVGIARRPFLSARAPRADDTDRFAIARPPDRICDHDHATCLTRTNIKAYTTPPAGVVEPIEAPGTLVVTSDALLS
jgi:hypothetical protein